MRRYYNPCIKKLYERRFRWYRNNIITNYIVIFFNSINTHKMTTTRKPFKQHTADVEEKASAGDPVFRALTRLPDRKYTKYTE